ncbi:hypothetical protein COX24_02710 [bacterium (Candidatus Gribaldobacteria) CG23_combo_of_CG06-09_8_20_14_all_37_87_8]|uniref:Uncharacterized protein n=1 Tax=bacterium (Candidatus Gribaldobacteria) CG23_combo_of_CG06-09_8_20_14_all_37_87_8 TaxID=2014278 RepID=A0A2G9ZEJ5_9BACT|nr:MAG: hypothetical protein COX24_02710 [bacterium (Candidatus Gribaldobacteria) CG23_combo_of_CG06-09_8_20_14_all_37_87_8]
MKAKKFGLFFSIKYIDQNIETYRLILKVMDKLRIQMYKPELITNYPNSLKGMKKDGRSLVEGTQRLLRSVDFAVAYFSDKSRVVFFQTITALENKTPVLCLVYENNYKNFPETLLSYGGGDFIQVRKYKSNNQLEEIISEYIEDLEPPKRRFNVVLKTKTLKQMEQLTRELDMTKAELVRLLVDKEYRRIFGYE